jgi:hypothetical protein
VLICDLLPFFYFILEAAKSQKKVEDEGLLSILKR